MRILDDLTTRKGLFAEAHMASLNSLPIEQLVVRFAFAFVSPANVPRRSQIPFRKKSTRNSFRS